MNINKLHPIKPNALTPFTLFDVVPSVESENLTYVEYLMGVLNQLNKVISTTNLVIDEITKLSGIVEDFPKQITDLQEAITTLQQWTAGQVLALINQIKLGDLETLVQAKAYTDQKINELDLPPTMRDPTTGQITDIDKVIYHIWYYLTENSITAQEYDNLDLTTEQYDNYNVENDPFFPSENFEDRIGIHAFTYDFWARKVFKLSEDSDLTSTTINYLNEGNDTDLYLQPVTANGIKIWRADMQYVSTPIVTATSGVYHNLYFFYFTYTDLNALKSAYPDFDENAEFTFKFEFQNSSLSPLTIKAKLNTTFSLFVPNYYLTGFDYNSNASFLRVNITIPFNQPTTTPNPYSMGVKLFVQTYKNNKTEVYYKEGNN